MSAKKTNKAKTIPEATKHVIILEHKIAKSEAAPDAEGDGLCMPEWLKAKINPESKKKSEEWLALSGKVIALREWYALQELLKQVRNGETSLELLEAELEATPYVSMYDNPLH